MSETSSEHSVTALSGPILVPVGVPSSFRSTDETAPVRHQMEIGLLPDTERDNPPLTIQREVEPEGQRQDAGIEAVTQHGPNVLHVGCGNYALEKLPIVFRAGWREIRLDIDPGVRPDLVASITDMRIIADRAMDAVYSSHNVEHLYPHEVPLALSEMFRVLKATGLALIKLPDLQEVARHIADGGLEDPLYVSPMGPIAPLDILYGHRSSLAAGNTFMAHRTGFTRDTLGAALIKAGFATVMIQNSPAEFSLTAVAFRERPSSERITMTQATMLPAPDRSAALYAAA